MCTATAECWTVVTKWYVAMVAMNGTTVDASRIYKQKPQVIGFVLIVRPKLH